jgi:hypothetical protein
VAVEVVLQQAMCHWQVVAVGQVAYSKAGFQQKLQCLAQLEQEALLSILEL